MIFLSMMRTIMFNILVTGSNGQLGRELHELSESYPYTFWFTCKEDLNISDEHAIQSFIERHAINVIINCAAYTAVDKAENDQELADKINHQAVKHLAFIAKEQNIRLIHRSTDYVFDGTNYTSYLEIDVINAQSIYGKRS